MKRGLTLATLMIGMSFVAAIPVGAATTTDVTFRSAPTVSEGSHTAFVIPSLHPYTQGVANTSTEAVWLTDPVNDTTYNNEDGVAGCQLTVGDDDGDGQIDGVEALDQATEEGCIAGWDYIEFECCGKLVTMVDDLWKDNTTTSTGYLTGWWQIQTDGHASEDGIEDMTLSDHEELSFVYRRSP